MNREDLKRAIEDTLEDIDQINNEIKKTADPFEKRKLIRRKREMQYLQLWHIAQLESDRLTRQ